MLCPFGLSAQQNISLPKRAPFQLAPEAQYLPGRVIFRVKPAYRAACSESVIGLPEIDSTLNLIQAQGLQKLFPTLAAPVKQTDAFGQELVDLSLVYTATFDPALSVATVVNLFLGHEAIEYCEPWYVSEIFAQPNDPYADTTGGNSGQWHLRQIWAREAWDIQRGDSTGVVVGVVDTGTSFLHPDMQDNIAFNTNDPVDGIDNDQDGYVDNYRGWDLGGAFLGSVGDNDPSYSSSSHGVGVAGTFGASTNNGIGVAGVCYNCKFLPIKAGPDEGGISHGYTGIVYAVEQGAKIVNCSWGGQDQSRFGEDVINYATINRGAAVIAACGNSGSETTYYPAAYERVISVANTTTGDTLDASSTYAYSVDIAAPGRSIWAPSSHGSYGAWPGTSVASPIVAGVVALVVAHFPGLSGYQAAQRVRITADDHEGQNFTRVGKVGRGRVNAYRALTDPLRPSIRKMSVSLQNTQGSAQVQSGDTVEIRGEFLNFLHPATQLTLELSTTDSLQNARVEILEPPRIIGPLAMGQGFSIQNQPLKIYVRPGAPDDFKIALRLTYRDTATGYIDFEHVEYWINRSFLDITENNLHTTLASKGNFGFNDYITQQQGLGLSYAGLANVLFEGGFLVGKSAFEVSDNIRIPTDPSSPPTQDDDFAVIEPVRRLNSSLAAFESEGVFDDSQAELPIGVAVRHKAYAFDSPGDENYVILTYSVKNNQPIPLNNVYAGLFADWDIAVLSEWQIRDACNFDAQEKLGFAYGLAGSNSSYYGISLLSNESFHAYATTGTSGFSFSDPSKYTALANAPTSGSASAGVSTGGEDIRHFVSGGPITINAQAEHQIAFAVMAGGIYQDLVQANAAAREKYRCVILGEGPVAGFSVSDTLSAPGNVLQFTDNNTTATTWSWDFGDGQTAAIANPQHSYSQPGSYTVLLTVSDGICEVQSRLTLEVSTSTAVLPAAGNPSLQIFPNPNTGRFQLSWQDESQGNFRICLRDLQGREVWHKELRKNGPIQQQTFDAGDLTPGFYLLSLTGEGLSLTRKLSIVRP